MTEYADPIRFAYDPTIQAELDQVAEDEHRRCQEHLLKEGLINARALAALYEPITEEPEEEGEEYDRKHEGCSRDG